LVIDLMIVKVRAHAFFGGRVQGVFFRANARRCAESLGLTGWVRNTSDGRVEAIFEGEENAVREAVEWCASKQPYAKVTSKHVEMSEATGEFNIFSIVP
jgi:acylphosphatase